MKKNYFLIASISIMLFNHDLKAQTFEWAKSFGGTSYDYGLSITVDASGNVYTTGRFAGTVDFDPGVGTYNLSSNGYSDVFVHKMSQAGVSVDKTQSADAFEAVLIPNPVSDYATLHLSGLKDYTNINIQIFDMTGRKVHAMNNQSSDKIPLKLNDLSKGVYVVQVLQGGRNVGVLKMVVR